MKLNKKKSAFTLIELLVVITIMWILAVGWISVYNTQIQKARDSNRITDVTNLQSAIEQFYQDKAAYPKWWRDWVNPDSFSVISIMPTLATDPKHDQPCAWKWTEKTRCWYAYKVQDSKSWIKDWAYEISTWFENEWNVESRAMNTKDGWNDENRLELGLEIDTINTSVSRDRAFGSTGLSQTDETTSLIITRLTDWMNRMIPAVIARENSWTD